jgi:hypothetical protein
MKGAPMLTTMSMRSSLPFALYLSRRLATKSIECLLDFVGFKALARQL